MWNPTPSGLQAKRTKNCFRFSTHSALTSFYDTKPQHRRRQIWRAPRRQVGKTSPAGAARLVTSGTIGRQPNEQIIQQNLGPEFHRESREPVRTRALTGVAAQANQHKRKICESPDRHAAKEKTTSGVMRGSTTSADRLDTAHS
jgi:hypothetical protein